jgi:YD repeat-containing protein
VLESDYTPVDIVWRRTRALLAHLQALEDALDLDRQAAALERLAPRVAALREAHSTGHGGRFAMALTALQSRTDGGGGAEARALFHEICAIRRSIAFSNPLLDFDRILFLKRHKSIFEHMCDQFYGIAARPGGGLFVLENAFTDAPRAVNILERAVVERGRLQGETLRGGVSPEELYYDGEGRLTESGDPGGGAFLSPDLSYDATQVLFSYVECRGDTRHAFRRENPGEYWKEPWDPGRAYHVFRVNIDGTGLEQLTDGPWNDMHACWMPDGRVVFVSERRGGFLRCGRVCPTYTMFQMDAGGGFIRPLSYHETHEWLPSVDHNGMIVYTRWDYVDRDSDIAHHLWLTYPDGRDPRGPHGNYPRVREHRPWIEQGFRAIPGSHKYLATAARHHGQHFGSLITVDLRIEDDAAASQLRRVTPEVMFPEAESAPGVPFDPRGGGGNGQVYGTPWPLSEDFYLAIYDPETLRHDLYLVDGFGNRELVYRDPEIACSDPIPLKPRPVPPVIPAQTRYAEDPALQPETGTIAVMNVYDSLRPWPEGTRLAALRVIQLFPKSTPAPGQPNIGAGDESLARGALGTVPIEADGSVFLEAPAGVPLYFQALDEDGMAVQTMRSATYLHPGEHLSCAGCHESKQAAPLVPARQPLAMRKAPARLQPEPEGSYPLQFSRLVQPVLDANCVDCHRNEDKAPDLAGDVLGEHGWSRAFHALVPYAWAKHGGNYIGLQRNKTSYSIPGEVGARASKLLALLEGGHHDVELTAEELRRITLWLDANSVFFGAYHDLVAQANGETVIPHLK